MVWKLIHLIIGLVLAKNALKKQTKAIMRAMRHPLSSSTVILLSKWLEIEYVGVLLEIHLSPVQDVIIPFFSVHIHIIN